MKINGKVIAVAAMLAVAGIGGTFAYFNQTLTAANIFDTGKYDTELVEEFKPSEGENWGPGTSVNKDVTPLRKRSGRLPLEAHPMPTMHLRMFTRMTQKTELPILTRMTQWYLKA